MSTSNPFYIEFEYGANKEGYWNYELMVLQLEDYVDCCKILYHQFDYTFLFNHSCEHDKQRDDGLDVDNMARGYGGRQSRLCNTKILTKYGFLWDFKAILEPGSVQNMLYTKEDNGPFYLSEAKRAKNKYDRSTGIMEQRKYQKSELLAMLKGKEFEMPPGTHI